MLTDQARENGAATRQPLLGRTPAELQAIAHELGLPAFVGKQLAQWMYGKAVASFGEMRNISLQSRARLAEHYCVGLREPLLRQQSHDGTAKYLFPVRLCGRSTAGTPGEDRERTVETVFIPDAERGTVCVSCQVGCKMGCQFCMTGRQGYEGSLTAADILCQIMALPERERLTNIVFMGQGEPMDNLEAVLRATQVLCAPWGWGWSPRRITVSTVGTRPEALRRFIAESDCHLAVSLHHPLPAERARIMPAERAWSIADVVELLRGVPCWAEKRGRAPLSADGPEDPTQSGQRRLSFEYIVFAGLNDTLRHADALLRLLRGLRCRVNLIRFHTIPGSPFSGASPERMVELRDYLTRHGLTTTIRASRGEDIMAACGLLNTAGREA